MAENRLVSRDVNNMERRGNRKMSDAFGKDPQSTLVVIMEQQGNQQRQEN